MLRAPLDAPRVPVPPSGPLARTDPPLAGLDCAQDAGCPGFTASRRGVLRGLALGGLTTITGSTVITMSSGLPAAAAASTEAGAQEPVLVVLSLRGAADGLSLVVPHGDPVYYQARPRIAVPADRLLAADGFFGLHPALGSLLPLWQDGELAAVHATGLPVANRSHFAAMEEVEDAAPGSAARTGWLNRVLGQSPTLDPLDAVSIGTGGLPTSLAGPAPSMSYPNLGSAVVAGDNVRDRRRSRRTSLQQVWQDEATAMGVAMRGAMSAVEELSAARLVVDNSASYPVSDLGRALSTVAQTLRGDVGVKVVTVDSGSWDMHANVGTLDQGRLLNNASDLGDSLAAFFADLGPVRSRVTVVTISEFGRRVAENATMGLDHGWGNVMLVAGAGVAGGRYLGRWPGLVDSLDADLSVTTDYRSVLAEVVAARFPAVSVPTVFPSFSPETVGVMRAT